MVARALARSVSRKPTTLSKPTVPGMQSSMKHGSIQILNRTGMTLADAKAAVAKMQAHHGIA